MFSATNMVKAFGRTDFIAAFVGAPCKISLVPETAFQSVTLFAAGVSLVGSGIDALRAHARHCRQFRKTAGTITRVDWPANTSELARIPYQIHIAFRTERGIARTFSPVQLSEYGMVHKAGERVSVWYLPDYPEKAQLQAPTQLVMRGTFGVLCGLLVVGWVMLS